MTPQVLFWAGLGGILPALMWLWFWLREDARHPEPKARIAIAFIGGMACVPLVLPLQTGTYDIGLSTPALFYLWAAFEEGLKLLACYLTALRFRDVDEPIDVLIYMLTVALGFSALENALFLVDPLTEGSTASAIITGNLRFMGASLLHVISSGTVGAFLGLAYYRSGAKKALFLAVGFAAAVVLHAHFNLFIIKETDRTAFATFGIVWVAIIVLMLAFEKVKTINNTPK